MKKIKVPFEYRISIIYIVLGALWILFSDKIMLALTSDLSKIETISTYKGWFYVFITGVFLFMLVKKEIRERNAIYQKLLEAGRKAGESERLKTAFLANISHYIRTPMNSVLGFVGLLQEKDIDEEKRNRFMAVVSEQSQYLLQLLTNIIEISKLQEGQMDVEEEPVSLNQVCRRLEDIYTNGFLLKNKTIPLFCSLGLNDGDDVVVTDQQKVHSVFVNLLNNAVKHSKSNRIEFGYKVENNLVICFVSDTGVGISEEKLGYIISGNMFTNTNYLGANEGIGLGLYLSYRMASLLGGKLWVEYSNASGTKICFSFLYKKSNGYDIEK